MSAIDTAQARGVRQPSSATGPTNRPPQGPWDLVVIGGGTAGIVAAKTAVQLGARVLLIERERTGGDCLWTGCVPSKALIASAERAASARGAAAFGVQVDGARVDFDAVMRHVRGAIAHIEPTDAPETLEREGVHVRHAEARFVNGGALEVDGHRVRFRQALIATGAKPAVPPIPGLDGANYLTSDTIWDLTDLPTDLVVLGGGSIGCELGQTFARLGSSVTIVEGAPRILPREDARAATVVAEALAADGVQVMTGQGVTGQGVTGQGVTGVNAAQGSSGRLTLEDGTVVPYGRLVVAVGRAPRTTGLGLAAAGVETDERGFVVVDPRLRTTNPRIWAAGDLTGHPQFTHTAGVHGSLAASNAMLGLRRSVTGVVPRVTFTQPEVAAVGLQTDSAGRSDGNLRVLHWDNAHVDRAVAEGDLSGFTKIAIDRRGRILGATVVGPRAGEVLVELTLAVNQGLRTRDLSSSTHPYPTYGDGAWNAAVADVRERLEAPGIRRLIAVLGTVRRWTLSRHD